MRMIDWEAGDDFGAPGAASFGEMVGWWIEAIDDGVWSWSEGDGRWLLDYERLRDPERLRTGLL
jgi:hypothetical protein